MNTKETLIAARELISDPKRWTHGTYARHENGNPIGPEEENAVCWCSIGALIRVVGSDGHSVKHCAYEVGRHQAGMRSLVEFNDNHTHAEVLAAFDRAIAGCES